MDNHSSPYKYLLDVRNLTKEFPVGVFKNNKLVHAVEDVSFTVSRGQVVALVGESGSGKTTTLRLISRLIPVTSGEVFFKDVDVVKSEPRSASLEYRRQVQYIFQDPFGSLNPVHTIEHHLSRPLLLHQKTNGGSETHDRVCELLETVELKPAEMIASRYPHQLSGGQRQRVAIARALAVDPELILADEPISMLDVSIRMGVLNLIHRLKEERGISFVYITHDLASARYVGDEIMVMYAGHMVEGGAGEAVLKEPAHPYTQLLLSAVPDPHAGLRTDRNTKARGEVPSLIDPPPGCPFAARCPKALMMCRKIMPRPASLGNGHWVRCNLYDPQG